MFVSRIFLAGGSTAGVGKHWLKGFLRRNLYVRSFQIRCIDVVCVNGVTTKVIQAWFPLLDLPAIKKVIQTDRWNIDETGFIQGIGANGLVFGIAEKYKTFKKDPGRCEWTTIIDIFWPAADIYSHWSFSRVKMYNNSGFRMKASRNSKIGSSKAL